MLSSTGHRILNRVRSHKRLRSDAANADSSHKRQISTASSVSRPSLDSDAHLRGHYPTIEWDPLKLNPPVTSTPATPRPIPQLHDGVHERTLRNKRSFAGHELRRPRHMQMNSVSSLEIHDGFDFGFEKEKALRSAIVRNRDDHHHHHIDGWPSPASSTTSSDWHEDDDGDVKRDPWDSPSPSPRRRPQPGPSSGPDYFMKRGGWKRRGIVFGGQTEEVYAQEDDAFDLP